MRANYRTRAGFVYRMMIELGGDGNRERLESIPDMAETILRDGAKYKTLQERECNQGLTLAEERRETAIEKRIVEMCKLWGIVPVFQGDPRGATVKLALPSGYTDDWGKTGLCVPTS